jgi:hypothetical protein
LVQFESITVALRSAKSFFGVLGDQWEPTAFKMQVPGEKGAEERFPPLNVKIHILVIK